MLETWGDPQRGSAEGKPDMQSGMNPVGAQHSENDQLRKEEDSQERSVAQKLTESWKKAEDKHLKYHWEMQRQTERAAGFGKDMHNVARNEWPPQRTG